MLKEINRKRFESWQENVKHAIDFGLVFYLFSKRKYIQRKYKEIHFYLKLISTDIKNALWTILHVNVIVLMGYNEHHKPPGTIYKSVHSQLLETIFFLKFKVGATWLLSNYIIHELSSQQVSTVRKHQKMGCERELPNKITSFSHTQNKKT